MSLTAAIGHAHGPDGRSAGLKAAQEAMKAVGRYPVVMAWIFASFEYPLREVTDGVAEALGEVPLLGFSTSGVWPANGSAHRSVSVALLAGESIEARADWWSGFVSDSQGTIQAMLKALRPEEKERSVLLVVTDGLGGDINELSAALPAGKYTLAGCMAGGNLYVGRTYQVGGRQSGAGGIAGALLSGEFSIGVGAAHGWRPLGAMAQLSQVQGLWVRTLDGRRPSQVYAELFAMRDRDWAFPPLNEMVRLYPLGLEQDEKLVVRSPLRIEVDGSLRMNTMVQEGQDAHIMVGSPSHCLDAARQATQQAFEALGGVHPVLAVVLVDAAWQTLMAANPGVEIEVVRQELARLLEERGHQIRGDHEPVVVNSPPIAGGYTYGQIVQDQHTGTAQVLNQHLVVLLFGDRRLVM